MMRKLKLSVVLSSLLLPLPVLAQTPPPAAVPVAPVAAPPAEPAPAAAPAPAPEAKKKSGGGPSLGLSPETPQVGGRIASPAEPAPVVAAEPSAEWKFDVTGYFRAPMRMSWGPAITQDVNALPGTTAGTQLRTPPLVPDANYIDWRYTNSLVAPWTELNFHYGNDRVKATVQIASYNLTDSGYRRLESNLGINQAFLTLLWPELGGSENWHLTLTVGGFTNRYGAAGRYDGGKYETYLFGRTHTAGYTLNVSYDTNDWTFLVEQGFGAKLEPIPFYGPPEGYSSMNSANQMLPAWEPYPGPVAQESAFVHHVHVGAVFKKQLLLGLHLINVFANDNERSTAYLGSTFDTGLFKGQPAGGRGSADPKPKIAIVGGDAKLLGGVLGDGYLGYSHLSAQNALYLGDAIEVLHSFGGWQLHDNYFGVPGSTNAVTGDIDSVEAQYTFSFGQLFWYPQAFWGQGPDLIASVFGMFNHIHAPLNPSYDGINKVKFGGEVMYLPLGWLGIGGRFDVVDPDWGKTDAERAATGAPTFMSRFEVLSPRLVFRTDFVTHEQILVQYSRYWYSGPAAGMFPYNTQTGAGGIGGTDSNAFQIAGIIWF
jgi:hypothetical protein